MKIGFIYPNVKYPPTTTMSVHAYQVSKNLHDLGHELYSPIGYKNPMIKECSWFLFLKHIDVLIFRVNGSLKWDIFNLIKLFRPSLPIIWLVETPGSAEIKSRWFLPSVDVRWRTLGKIVNAVVCVSREVHDYFDANIGIQKNIIAPNGSDPEVFSPEQRNDTIYQDLKNSIKVLWLGSGEYPWHNVEVISDVAEKIYDIEKRVQFVLINTRKTPRLNRKNITLLDRVPYFSAPQYISSADICLCLYNLEYYEKVCPGVGFYASSLKLFDFMSCAKPTIATSAGQIKEVIRDGENGLLTDNSIDDITDKILFLAQNFKQANVMGQAARNDIVAYYNWRRVGKQIEEVCFNLV